MLLLNLKPIFKARGITRPYTYLVKAGFTPHAANVLINDKSRVFRLDHIEQLCKVLVCEPNDLLLWIPEKGQKYADNFPLLKLTKTDKDNYWQETIAKIPLNQLRELTNAMVNNSKAG